ncbi:hypothetical protein CDL15_Pgr019671 [Punica granatum]|nr:hypothetical protein CDL15_Pgr019671 [Punica granatum]
MGGNSTTWMNTAVLVTCIRNFRHNRGPVSGILKGFVGLSTAIFTDLSASLFPDPSPSTFLLMLSVVPLAVCLSAVIFLRELPPTTSSSSTSTVEDPEEEASYFGVFNAVAVAVALYLLAFDVSGPHGPVFSKIFAAVLLILLASPISVPVYSFLKTVQFSGKPVLDVERPEIAEPLLSSHQESTVAVEKEVAVEKKAVVTAAEEGPAVTWRPVIGEDHTIMEAVTTVDFWIMFVSFLCGVGTGLAVMNNMGQMGLALGYSDVSMFVSLMSIWGFFGRIGSGTISEYFLKKAGTPRPLWNAASQVLMAVGYILMALALPGSLYIGSVVVGICYGVRLAVTVPTASELFGLKYYGLIYNILILNLPLGSFLFSGLLAGLLYDAQATQTPSGGNTCVGAHCYRLVFVVMAMACVVGFGLDVLLAVRTKRVYAKIYASKKLKKQETSNGQ